MKASWIFQRMIMLFHYRFREFMISLSRLYYDFYFCIVYVMKTDSPSLRRQNLGRMNWSRPIMEYNNKLFRTDNAIVIVFVINEQEIVTINNSSKNQSLFYFLHYPIQPSVDLTWIKCVVLVYLPSWGRFID